MSWSTIHNAPSGRSALNSKLMGRCVAKGGQGKPSLFLDFGVKAPFWSVRRSERLKDNFLSMWVSIIEEKVANVTAFQAFWAQPCPVRLPGEGIWLEISRPKIQYFQCIPRCERILGWRLQHGNDIQRPLQAWDIQVIWLCIPLSGVEWYTEETDSTIPLGQDGISLLLMVCRSGVSQIHYLSSRMDIHLVWIRNLTGSRTYRQVRLGLRIGYYSSTALPGQSVPCRQGWWVWYEACEEY